MAKTPRLVLVLLISGCASVESLVPQNGPTMAEIYNSHLDDSGGSNAGEEPLRQARLAAARRDATDVEPDLRGYSRDVETEIDNLFPTLPNPMLVMHVFPHLAGEERLPVPGYSTSFSLYPRTEFALPGEVAVPTRSARARPTIRIIGGVGAQPSSPSTPSR